MKGKTILTGNDAIQAYETTRGSISHLDMPKVCGYFPSDDCKHTQPHFDSGTIIAFDATSGDNYEMAFSNVNEAVDWIEL